MATDLLKHSAISYLNQWYTTDRHFMSGIEHEQDVEKLALAFSNLASKYMVARNFKVSEIKKQQDFPQQFWIAVSHKVSSTRIIENSQNDLAIKELAAELGKLSASLDKKSNSVNSHANLISAATKFLWFRGHHNVRIYDKRAVLALNNIRKKAEIRPFRVNSNYTLFSQEWDKQFESHVTEITLIIQELKNLLFWTMIPPIEHDYALKAMECLWFKERIFDKYLWTSGSTVGAGATAFI